MTGDDKLRDWFVAEVYEASDRVRMDRERRRQETLRAMNTFSVKSPDALRAAAVREKGSRR